MDERGSSRARGAGTRSRRPGSTSELAQCSLSRNSARGDAARACTSSGRRTRRRSSSAARAARSSTSRSTSVPARRRTGEWFGVRLDAENGRALYVPEGCAHGFQTLVDETRRRVHDLAPYAPEASAGVRWDDPVARRSRGRVRGERTISERDRTCPAYGPEPDLSRAGGSSSSTSSSASAARGSPGTAARSGARCRARLAAPSERLSTQRSAASSLEPPAERAVEPPSPELWLAVRRRVDERLVPLEDVDDLERARGGSHRAPRGGRGRGRRRTSGTRGTHPPASARRPRTADRSPGSRTGARRRRRATRSTIAAAPGRAARPPRPGRPPRPRAGSACTSAAPGHRRTTPRTRARTSLDERRGLCGASRAARSSPGSRRAGTSGGGCLRREDPGEAGEERRSPRGCRSRARGGRPSS